MCPCPESSATTRALSRFGSASAPSGQSIFWYATCASSLPLPRGGGAYADKGVDLQVETITDTARVLVDRQRFGQVMSNLLSNALRHTPAGGQVRISVHRQGGRLPRSSTSPMTARASHLASSDTSSNASTGGCRPQLGQQRGRYRSDHLQGIDRGPRRHSHRLLPRTRSRSGVCPPPPAVPSRQ